MIRRTIAVLFVLSLFAGAGAAQQTQSIDTVVIASTANYPDALVGSAASANTGSPILLTESSELDSSVQNALPSMQPEEVVLLGGPAVISEQVKSELSQDYEVTRLWGATRYGTASDIAEYFWPAGSNEALLVENEMDDERGNILAVAKEMARDREIPIYLTPSDGVPADVLSSMESLDVEDVTVVGEVEDESVSQLSDIGVSVRETVSGENEQEVEENVREKVLEKVNGSEEFVVVASNDFRHSIASIRTSASNSYRIGSSDEVDGLVSFLAQAGLSKVKLVGEPGLASDVASELEGEEVTVDLRSANAGQAASMANNISEEELDEIRKAHGEMAKELQQRIEQNRETVKDRANRSIVQAEEMVEQYGTSEDANESLGNAKTALENGEFHEALKEAKNAVEKARENRWNDIENNETRIQEAIRSETADLREKTQELTELNREFGEEMSENMSVEERLEVIEEFRGERREVVKDIMEEAQSIGKGKSGDRISRARERVSTGFEQDVELECARPEDPSFDEVSIEFDDGEDHTGVEGTIGLNTPNYRPVGSAEIDRDQQEVSFTLSYEETKAMGGIQCTGASEFELRQDVPASGEWEVALTVTVEGEQRYQDSKSVSVTADDETEEKELPEEEGDDETEGVPEDENDDDFKGNETHAAPTGTSGDPDEDPEQSDETPEQHMVEYTSDGFDPATVEIEPGDTVVWQRKGDAPQMDVAVNQHPSHTNYDGTRRSQHCSGGATEDVFDSCGTKDTYEFTFDEEGEWEYHNHAAAFHRGKVQVDD